jgi:hypothetical protein
MFAANSHRIRLATDEDADTLRRLAEHSSQPPLTGRVLIGQIDGVPAAALSLRDGRIVADAFRRTDHVVANLRVRAVARRALEATPALRQRLLAPPPAWYRAGSMPASGSMSHNAHAEHEPVLVAA